MSYGDYVEQLTFLLFLKIADEQSRAPFNKRSPIPKDFYWRSLHKRDSNEPETHYQNFGDTAEFRGHSTNFSGSGLHGQPFLVLGVTFRSLSLNLGLMLAAIWLVDDVHYLQSTNGVSPLNSVLNSERRRDASATLSLPDIGFQMKRQLRYYAVRRGLEWLRA